MGVRRLRLAGFETELLGFIADGFRFSADPISDLGLELDRHLFDSDMPDPKEIATTSPGFEQDREPAISVYRQPGGGIDPSSSSGSRLAFNILVVLRAPGALSEARSLLDELIVWLENNAVGAATPHFLIKGFRTLGMPVAIERLPDDQSKASATVRFLAVARN